MIAFFGFILIFVYMRKLLIIGLTCLCFLKFHAQSESNLVDSDYLEDQIYISLTYNVLTNIPTAISQNGFSGGFSAGFIKDIPLNKNRNVGLGLGLGYTYQVYIQNLKMESSDLGTSFTEATDYKTNRFGMSALEIPIEFRWRTSTPEKYKFWRIYGGINLSYVLKAKSNYRDIEETIVTANLPEFNNFQYGIMLAAGYSTWNLNVYYGLSSLFKNAQVNGEKLTLNELRIGLKFYIL